VLPSVRGTSHERLDHREPPVRRRFDLGISEGLVAGQRGAEPLDTAPYPRRRHVALDHDLCRVDGADTELALERVEPILGRVAVRERPHPSGARSQAERR
jgi:hypothetical protein